jgi:hypothetical protein
MPLYILAISRDMIWPYSTPPESGYCTANRTVPDTGSGNANRLTYTGGEHFDEPRKFRKVCAVLRADIALSDTRRTSE